MADKLQAKRDRQQAEVLKAKRLALATGGCELCFKPHDLGGPSCNRLECRARWERHTGVKAAPITRGIA